MRVMYMELRQLRHFVAVVERGTFSGASEILHLTQPALTRSIKTLEELLQAVLLERKARGVEPTEAGHTLYRHAKLILSETSTAIKDVASTAAGEQGHLHLGIAPMFATSITDDVILKLSQDYPNLKLRVTSGLYEELLSGLRLGQMDVLFANIPTAQLPSDVHAQPLVDVTSYFMVGADHPLAAQNSCSLDDLRNTDWAMVRQNAMTNDLMGLFSNDDADTIEPKVETNSLTLLRTLLTSGRFVTILPEHLLADDLMAGRVVRLKVAGTPFMRQAGIILRGGGMQRPPVAHFLKAVDAAIETWKSP